MLNEPVFLPAGYQATPENGQHSVCRQQFAAGFVFRTHLGRPEILRRDSRKMGGKPIEEDPNPNFYVAHPRPAVIPKMGKCYEITHFLDFLGISSLFSHPNNLITFVIKKSVSLVPLVPTVHFAVLKIDCLEKCGLERGSRVL
jgi:hypothetical protein